MNKILGDSQNFQQCQISSFRRCTSRTISKISRTRLVQTTDASPDDDDRYHNLHHWHTLAMVGSKCIHENCCSWNKIYPPPLPLATAGVTLLPLSRSQYRPSSLNDEIYQGFLITSPEASIKCMRNPITITSYLLVPGTSMPIITTNFVASQKIHLAWHGGQLFDQR